MAKVTKEIKDIFEEIRSYEDDINYAEEMISELVGKLRDLGVTDSKLNNKGLLFY